MNVRFYKPEDEEAVKEFSVRHKISFDLGNRIIVLVEDDEKNIKGVGAIRSVAFIEPLISEHPIATYKVYDTLMQLLKKLNQPIVRCITGVENKRLFEKIGFEEVFQDQIIMEKNI